MEAFRMTSWRVGCSRCAWLAAALLATGCADEVVLEDSGLACLTSTAGWSEAYQTFQADAPAYVTVRLDSCLSSTCTSDYQASCEAVVTGDSIVISAHGSYADESGAGSSCSQVCLTLDAACETPPLAEGSYTVVYGEEEISLDVPSVTGAYCVPQRP
jgi:hypothetical protein